MTTIANTEEQTVKDTSTTETTTIIADSFENLFGKTTGMKF